MPIRERYNKKYGLPASAMRIKHKVSKNEVINKKWCPQHGYPLPCDKCGLGLFEAGRQAGMREVVEWLGQHYVVRPDDSLSQFQPYYMIAVSEVEAKLKEWGIEDDAAK